jgi:hypothetical protein
VGKKKPIGATQGVLETRRYIEVYHRKRNIGGLALRVWIPGQRHQIKGFGYQACDEG